MYFYNPRVLQFYQNGGAISDGPNIQQQIQVLQQQINNFNLAIANPDQSEIVEYNADRTPTGELDVELYHVWGNPADNARDLQENLLEKTNARLFLQNKLNRIMSHVQRGGATAEQEIQNLQQKIATLNQAIAIQNADEEADYVDGIPTGEVSEALHATSANQQQVYEAIQERKIDARDYFQTRLNQLQAFNQTQHAQALPDEVVANIMRRIQ